MVRTPAAAPTVPTLDQSLPVLQLGDPVVDLGAGIVDSEDGRETLTGLERRMLLELVRCPGSVVDPGRLIRLAGVTGGRSALGNAIYRLRAKIEPDPAEPRWLVGVRGQGYRLDATPERASRSLDDISETLWAIAEHAGHLMGLDDCVVYARDGNYLVQVAAYGIKAAAPGQVADPIALRVGEGIVGTAARKARPQVVADVLRDPRYVHDIAPGRSELAMPIIADAEVVGVIDSESPLVGAYDELHRQSFQSMAAIAAAAARDVSRALAA